MKAIPILAALLLAGCALVERPAPRSTPAQPAEAPGPRAAATPPPTLQRPATPPAPAVDPPAAPPSPAVQPPPEAVAPPTVTPAAPGDEKTPEAPKPAASSPQPAPAASAPTSASGASAPPSAPAAASPPKAQPPSAAAPAAKAPASRAAAAPPAPAAAPSPAPPQRAAASPGLDLKTLEDRLRSTRAIGVLTKLSIKNEVDDLIDRFRAYHEGRERVPLTDLRRPYNLLIMKVLSLLQDEDPSLAGAIAASREQLWGILADKSKFSQAA